MRYSTIIFPPYIIVLNIYCEDTLTYNHEFFDDVGDVHYFSAKDLTPDHLKNADILFVRSTTRVDAALLAQATQLKFVATATAGSDHLDLNYLQERGIETWSAAGCNAIAVAEYVIAGILWLSATKNLPIEGKSIGIVGAGNVGTALTSRAEALGLEVHLCDPPLQESGDPREFVALDKALDCDVISLHVPYIAEGPYPTLHLINQQRLKALRPDQILVNACRGEVVDNQSLFEMIKAGAQFHTIFDVWENEPAINFELAALADIATPHIAGHSLEGKARGTEMVYIRAAEKFGWPKKSMWDFLPAPLVDAARLNADPDNKNFEGSLHLVISKLYDIEADSCDFKSQVKNADQFRYSRKHYGIRREFACAQVNAGNSRQLKALFRLGFKTLNS